MSPDLNWEDALEDHGIYVGSIKEFLEFIPQWERDQDTTHVMGTIIIDFDSPSVARTETYIRSFYNMPNGAHEMPRFELPEGGRQELEVGGRYLDRFEKRGSEWRIAHRLTIHTPPQPASPNLHFGWFASGFAPPGG